MLEDRTFSMSFMKKLPIFLPLDVHRMNEQDTCLEKTFSLMVRAIPMLWDTGSWEQKEDRVKKAFKLKITTKLKHTCSWES